MSNTNALDEQINSMLVSGKSGKSKKKSKKKLWIVLGILVVGVAGFLGFQSMRPKGPIPVAVETGTIVKGDIDETLVINGPVEGTDSVDITSGIHAKVIELPIKEGDHVEQGITVLAKLDPESIQQGIDAAQGIYDLKVAQKEDKIRGDNHAYQKALSDLDTAQRNYDRTAELVASGASPQADLDQAGSVLDSARRAVSAFDTKGGKVVAGESFDIDIENSKREIEKLEKQMNDTVLIAPITGTVTRVNTKVGQFADSVENRSPMLTIENLDSLQMELMVSEFSIGKVNVGQPVTITADILGEGNSVQGEISSISPTGQPKGNGETERVIPVKVKILDKDSKLISGISAKATILLNSAKDAYLVPLSAVGDDGTGKSVMQFIIKDDSGAEKIAIKEVQTGIEGNIQMQIMDIPLEGVEESEVRFLTAYDSKLTEGTLVVTSEKETNGAK